MKKFLWYRWVWLMLLNTWLAIPVLAAEYTLRAQTVHAKTSLSGQAVQQLVNDVELMSAGKLVIEVIYSSGLVKSVETFNAAAEGIIDIDMTSGQYQTSLNPAFQFVGDVPGGYDNPWQFVAWLKHGGGRVLADELYGNYGMHLVGWWPTGMESLTSTQPLRNFADLRGWKFRSPPGLGSEIFAGLGASPVALDFTEVFIGLETGIIDGADASSLANNERSGILDIAKHATFPGFHSMPAEHLAINKDKWDELPRYLQRIIEVALNSVTLDNMIAQYVANFNAATRLKEQGVTLYDWSDEDRKQFRSYARSNWERWADKSPEARKAVDLHVKFMHKIKLLN